jgi:EAL domain-containing protein (putative c-di-GMP-specific phosphodiesterase class I)
MIDSTVAEVESGALPALSGNPLGQGHDQVGERLSAIAAIIERDAVEMVYQPVVDMRDGRVLGWEALSRFPSLPFSTAEVFEAVNGTELEVELEVLCIRKAVEVSEHLDENTYLSVNLSPTAVRSPEVAALLVPANQLLEHLVIEITERTAIEDYLPLYRPLRELRQRLVSVAIDDVGAGYASLWHITQLLPDIIKIDRALISGIDQSPTKRAIVTALLSLARELRCHVVAEGVEQKQEADWLIGLGTRFGQGFHFAEPKGWRQAPEGRAGNGLRGRGESGGHSKMSGQSSHEPCGIA